MPSGGGLTGGRSTSDRRTRANESREPEHRPHAGAAADPATRSAAPVGATATLRAVSPAVHVSDATMTYGSATIGATPALGPLSLPVEASEIVSVIGPSGCGKTTLLRLIAGLATPTS